MAQSTLRQVLTTFETADGPLVLSQLARDLGVSIEQLDVMIRHWINKGRIRESIAPTVCGSCGYAGEGSCPFVMELPRSYELVKTGERLSLPVLTLTCRHNPAPDGREGRGR